MTGYDLILYGATGRTGSQIASELAREAAGAGMRWAIAGRNRTKLHWVADRLEADVGVIEADLHSSRSADRLVTAGRVILNAAGPYSLSAEPLVAACAARGTDYLDITGETAHVRRLIDRYHRLARSTGSKIVPFCGFDSVPSDIGVLMLVEWFRRREVETGGIKGFFRVAGRLNSGTVSTAMEVWRRPGDLDAMEDPHLLDPEVRSIRGSRSDADPLAPYFDPDLGRWVGPFWTGPISTRVVRRSRALMAGWGRDYGASFRYHEYWDPGGPVPWLAAASVAWGMATYRVMSRTPGIAEVLGPIMPAGDEIPCEVIGDGGFFRGLFFGQGEDGSRTWSLVAGRGDPSNQATVRIVTQCALMLAMERDVLPGAGTRAGILTPATAFGTQLLPRLRSAGIRVECPLEGH